MKSRTHYKSSNIELNLITFIFLSVPTITPDGEFHPLIDADDFVLASGFGSLKDFIDRTNDQTECMNIKQIKSHLYLKYVADYYQVDKTALGHIKYKLIGTEFQNSIWKVVSSIKYGSTASYKDIALKAGRPTAIRVVGTACSRNRLVLLIPYHRVIRSDGTLGNYLYESKIKQSLLTREITSSNTQNH